MPDPALDKFRVHSVRLNALGWKLAEAVGDVGPDDDECDGQPEEQLERLIAERDTLQDRAESAEAEIERLTHPGPVANTCGCLGCTEWRELGGWRARAENAEGRLAAVIALCDAPQFYRTSTGESLYTETQIRAAAIGETL